MKTLTESLSSLLNDRLSDLAARAEDSDPLRTALFDNVRHAIISHAQAELAQKLINLLSDDDLRKIATVVNEP